MMLDKIKQFFNRTFKNRNFKVGFIIVSILLFIALLSVVWTPHDPNYIYDDAILEGSSLRFIFGTDYLGRDNLSRLMVSMRTAFVIGTVTLIFSATIGITIGLISGYIGGKLDEILMRIVDMWMTMPGIIMALVFVAAFGTGMFQTILAISLLGFSSFAKIVRAKVLSIKELDKIIWAKSVGVKKSRIIYAHILPDLLPIICVIATSVFASAITIESSLSYLGLGVQPPDASLGTILSRAQGYILTNPLYPLIPAVLITLIVVGFNLISDGINKIYGAKKG